MEEQRRSQEEVEKLASHVGSKEETKASSDVVVHVGQGLAETTSPSSPLVTPRLASVLRCFSLTRNARYLLAPPRGGDFDFFDGIRVLSILCKPAKPQPRVAIHASGRGGGGGGGDPRAPVIFMSSPCTHENAPSFISYRWLCHWYWSGIIYGHLGVITTNFQGWSNPVKVRRAPYCLSSVGGRSLTPSCGTWMS